MASNTVIHKAKRKAKRVKAGRKRKNIMAKKSTPSAKEFFAEIDAAPKG